MDGPDIIALNFFQSDVWRIPVGVMRLKHSFHQLAAAHIFISNEPLELVFFCHYHPQWTKPTACAIFISIGHRPNKTVFEELTAPYVNARIHTVFGSDISGRIWDCRVSLWRWGLDAEFLLQEGLIRINIQGKEIQIEERQFSLNRFLKATRKLRGGTVHKPKGRAGSFVHKFCAQNPEAWESYFTF